MTHTLHRLGTSENLANDYVILAMSAKGHNEEGSADKLRKFLQIAKHHDPINMGDMSTGNMYQTSTDEIIRRVADTSIVHVVLCDIQKVVEVVQEVKKANLGMSIVVSGLFEPVRMCCEYISKKPSPHTIEHSLGLWGRIEKLPNREILEISTMCGHGMVSFNLVRDVVEDIKAGHITEHEAALKLAKPCVCGIFNPTRAALLLGSMSSK